MARYLARAAFTKAWRLVGQPQMRLIGPISTWTLPAGVAWDNHYNQFLDSQGAAVQINWHTQPATVVPFLPRRGRREVRLEPIGIVTTETTGAVLLWSAELQAQIESAWGVEIGGRLYRIRQWDVKPLGVSAPNEIELSLVEGEAT